ncbi:protein ANTAGONIST OF LIKE HETEROCHROMATIN PROTEIN 1 [Syzygium oleosum]|uniref:protein ANTAGONIST OF LIKE HETEROCHROMATIN PROTEIN 1 n=1 Tax=Syzygium oleosum TaxID=219896 RepID=UPI0011D27465|nr:protein ANTAGONIST OF LIKE HETEROCHROMATIN PROTEIN 1 [Syzygium oleosum]XP_030455468.1 protein ANTAGONIST OF LIKE HETEROCHROMATIN PROTEIN 1 [Syzygium oleosum]
MGSSDDEKDGAFENLTPKALSPEVASDGAKFVDEVLNGQNECCLDNFRMDKNVFYKLCNILQSRGLLRHTNRIKIEEQLAIFLFIIGHNLRTRAVQELFRYSGETISRHFNNVLNAIVAISLDFFQPPGSDVPREVLENPKLFPYFKDCVGMVDSIQFPVMVAVDEQGPFRNKNGLLTQNVLAACSFDLKFHYVLAGWEGSASELRVLHSALTRNNKLQVPEGRYYLVDIKYANLPGFLAPYHDVPYHLKGLPGDHHPQDAKELFNQRHSLLRNVTNRIFGALKARFPILTSTPPYPLQTQVKLVVAACAIHNYIRTEKPDDWLFRTIEHGDVIQTDEALPSVEVEQPMLFETQDLDFPFVTEDLEMSLQLRDSVATEMWNDYINDDLSGI